MRMSEAQALMARGRKVANLNAIGYRIYFERVQGPNVLSGQFPDRDEPLIRTVREASMWAEKFSRSAPAQFVNIQVMDEAGEKLGPVRRPQAT